MCSYKCSTPAFPLGSNSALAARLSPDNGPTHIRPDRRTGSQDCWRGIRPLATLGTPLRPAIPTYKSSRAAEPPLVFNLTPASRITRAAPLRRRKAPGMPHSSHLLFSMLWSFPSRAAALDCCSLQQSSPIVFKAVCLDPCAGARGRTPLCFQCWRCRFFMA